MNIYEDTKQNELLNELFATLKSSLESFKISSKMAHKISLHAVTLVRKNWGGIMVYIPKNDAIEKNERDLKIKADFTGNNHTELCKRYHLSLQRIYKILKKTNPEIT